MAARVSEVANASILTQFLADQTGPRFEEDVFQGHGEGEEEVEHEERLHRSHLVPQNEQEEDHQNQQDVKYNVAESFKIGPQGVGVVVPS